MRSSQSDPWRWPHSRTRSAQTNKPSSPLSCLQHGSHLSREPLRSLCAISSSPTFGSALPPARRLFSASILAATYRAVDRGCHAPILGKDEPFLQHAHPSRGDSFDGSG